MARSLIGACGIVCSSCPIFIATASSDMPQKELLALELSATRGKKLQPPDIACWGCRSSDRNCFSAKCFFRKCVKNKGLEFCYRCGEFPCHKLKGFYKENPSAQENLRKICKIGVEAFAAQLAEAENTESN